MYKTFYSQFLSHLGDRLHFAAHSHHAWPDVSREAHLKYWDDSARLWDDKWESIFAELMPTAQKKIANLLNLKDERQIAFAPNTHELVMRLFTCFELDRPMRILTTANEFHSFRRQVQRMEEAGKVIADRVQADLLAQDRSAFLETLKEKLQSQKPDLFFMSQVFFDSGLALTDQELLELSKAASTETVICIDGYHSFGAMPVDLSKLEGRVFYLAGGYKYAQAGEGACFMVVPKGNWRPIYTGWFAEMETLSKTKTGTVPYPEHGSAFSGSTFDPSGLYRFNAVWDLFEKEGITVSKIHNYVQSLQEVFLQAIPQTFLKNYRLMNPSVDRGHFITFDLGTPEECSRIHSLLKNNGVLTDFRGQRLRFGFGIYQTRNDVEKLLDRVKP